METKDKLITAESLKLAYENLADRTDSLLTLKQNRIDSISVELTAAGWVTDEETGVITQTVEAPGVTEHSLLLVSPCPDSAEEYASYIESGVFCSGQGMNTVTFTCAAIPVSENDVSLEIDVSVNIAII